jgi:hypothetical protein
MAWLDLQAETAEELGGCYSHQKHAYVERAFAEAARRRLVRNATAKDRRQIDRLRRVHDRIPQLPRPHACACGAAFAMPGGLIAHGRFCAAGALT